MRYSLGLQGGEGNELVYLSALDKIVKICKRLGKPVGVFAASGEVCKKRTAEGFDFILVNCQAIIQARTLILQQCPGEAALLVSGAKASLADCKNGARAGKL